MITFTNDTQEVLAKISQFEDLAMGNMAANIERKAKTKAPHDKGNLRSSIHSVKIDRAKYQVIATAKYAAAQEVGYRHNAGKQRPLGKKIEFKKYSEPGSGAHYMENAINDVKDNAKTYIDSSLRAVGL